MAFLFGRKPGGKSGVGRFDPSANEDTEEETAEEEDATAEDDPEAEGEDVPEDDGGAPADDEDSEGEPDDATSRERARWTSALGQFDLPAGACAAAEALAEGVSVDAAVRLGQRIDTGGEKSVAATARNSAALSARRSAAPKVPSAKGGKTGTTSDYDAGRAIGAKLARRKKA